MSRRACGAVRAAEFLKAVRAAGAKGVTPEEAAEAMGWFYRTCEEWLRELERQGLLERSWRSNERTERARLAYRIAQQWGGWL